MGSHNNMWNKRDKNGKFVKKSGVAGGNAVISVNPAMPVTQAVARAVTGPSLPVISTKPKLVNHIAIVLDHSGSMSSIREDTRKHLNRTIRTIIENAKSSNQETTVSLYRFGTDDYPFALGIGWRRQNGVTEDKFCVPVEQINEIETYNPGGNTPLFDGVGYAIERLSARHDANDKNVSFLVIVITDGQENASNKYSAMSLNELMKKVQGTDRWTLSFLLPPRSKSSFCSRFAIPEGNVQEWEATTLGVALASHQTQTGVTHYYAARGTGASSTTSFYVDLNKVDSRDVQNKLQNIQDKVKMVKVDKEVEIAKFVEEKTGKPYSLGTAFYQLTKPETIQAGKQILVKEKTGNAVYGGYDARKVLGIPEGQDLKVKPGNLANWDVFCQSTSTNRKLVRGSTLVVMK